MLVLTPHSGLWLVQSWCWLGSAHCGWALHRISWHVPACCVHRAIICRVLNVVWCVAVFGSITKQSKIIGIFMVLHCSARFPKHVGIEKSKHGTQDGPLWITGTDSCTELVELQICTGWRKLLMLFTNFMMTFLFMSMSRKVAVTYLEFGSSNKAAHLSKASSVFFAFLGHSHRSTFKIPKKGSLASRSPS